MSLLGFSRTVNANSLRLVFIASCQLMDAAIGRFDFMFDHNLFFPALDGLIVLGMARDWAVDGRVHRVYLYGLPAMMAELCNVCVASESSVVGGNHARGPGLVRV